MSFLSILKTVGKDALGIVSVAAPIIEMIDPAIGEPLTIISNMIIKAEQVYTEEKQGTSKKQYVMDEFTALLPLFQSAIKAKLGYVMTIDAAQVGNLIDSTVAQFNAAAALHSSFTFTKV